MKKRQLLLVLLATLCVGDAMASDYAVDGYEQLKTRFGLKPIPPKRVSLNEFEYTYKVRVTSKGPLVALNTFAYLTSKNPAIKVIKGAVNLGQNIAVDQTKTSEDTFTFRLDRSKPFKVSDLVWTVSDLYQNPGEYKILSTLDRAQGSSLNGLTQLSDGNYYGTAIQGGAYGFGSVYRVSSTDGSVQVLHSFNSNEGYQPRGILLGSSDGFIYGTTTRGGAYNVGTAFKVSLSGELTSLHDFNPTLGEGASPHSLVEGNDGKFYGTTFSGGTNDKGTIFQLSRTGEVVTLHSFSGADGENPTNPLLFLADGFFWGVTTGGGAYNKGAVFKLAIPVNGSMVFTLLHSFRQIDGSNQGFSPTGVLTEFNDVATGHELYGTTQSGGTKACGTIYKINQATGVMTWLHSFTGNLNGCIPTGGLTLRNGTSFYGTTNTGGTSSKGSLFIMSRQANPLTVHNFDDSENSAYAPLLLNRDGQLIGTTRTGVSGNGRIFTLPF
jgi:uncharacterized repeat protein (TIGR03803 family)